MHVESYFEMKKNLSLFAPELLTENLTVLDVGSLDVKKRGNYRDLFNSNITYIGCDITAGPNVDVVLRNENAYPWPSNFFDIIISGQTIEHCTNPFAFVRALEDMLKPKGKLFLAGPSAGRVHHKPDRWRIQPDGMTTLLEYAGLTILKVYVNLESEYWLDCWGIAQK